MLNKPSAAHKWITMKTINRSGEAAGKAAASSQGLQAVKFLLGESSLRLRWLSVTHSNALDDLKSETWVPLRSIFFSLQLFHSLFPKGARPFFHWGCAQFHWPCHTCPKWRVWTEVAHQKPQDAYLPSHSPLLHLKNLLKGFERWWVTSKPEDRINWLGCERQLSDFAYAHVIKDKNCDFRCTSEAIGIVLPLFKGIVDVSVHTKAASLPRLWFTPTTHGGPCLLHCTMHVEGAVITL